MTSSGMEPGPPEPPGLEITPRALRAAKRAARTGGTAAPPAPMTPSPAGTLLTKQPLHYTNPSVPLPPLLTQPDFGPAFGSPTNNSSGLHIDEEFFSSPNLAVNQETQDPDLSEAYFQDSMPDHDIDVPSDFDFDSHSNFDELSSNYDGQSSFGDDMDVFGKPRDQAVQPNTHIRNTAPPPNTPLAGVPALPAPHLPAPHLPPPRTTSPPPGPVDSTGASATPRPGFDITAANRPAGDEQTGARCLDTLDGDSEDDDNYDSPQRQRPGRISKQTHAIIEDFKAKMDRMVAEYSEKSGRTETNLVSLWGSGRGYTRVHRSSWNKYQIHFADNRVQERARVKNADADCNECFIGFKAEYGKKWKQVLDIFDEMNMVRRTNQHESSRAGTFDKIVKDITRTAHKAHILGFESVTFFVGNKLHHDQGLGEVIESPGATGFWSSLPMTSDSVINFLQNYAFDVVAQTAQDDSARALQASHPQFFNRDYQFNANTSKGRNTTAPSNIASGSLQPVASSSSTKHPGPPPRPPKRDASPSAASTTSSIAVKKDGGKGDNYEDIVRAYLYEELERQGCSFPTSQMPWSNLKLQIAGQGFVLEGWPEATHFPVDMDPTAPRDKEKKQPPAKKAGMRTIGAAGRRALAAACAARTLKLVRYKVRETSDLTESRVAWITGVRPTDQTLGRRQCLFNGKCFRLRPSDPTRTPPTLSATAESTPKPSTLSNTARPSAPSAPAPAPAPSAPAPAPSAPAPAPAPSAPAPAPSAPAPAPVAPSAPAPAPPSTPGPVPFARVSAPAPAPAPAPPSTTGPVPFARVPAPAPPSATAAALAPPPQQRSAAARRPFGSLFEPQQPPTLPVHSSAPAPPTQQTAASATQASGGFTLNSGFLDKPKPKPKPRPTGKAKNIGFQSFSHPECNPIWSSKSSTEGTPPDEASTATVPGSSTTSTGAAPSSLMAPPPNPSIPPVINSPPPAVLPSPDITYTPVIPPAIAPTPPPTAPSVTIKRPADNVVNETETKKPRGITPPATNPAQPVQVLQSRQLSPIPQMQMSPMQPMHHPMGPGMHPMFAGMGGQMPSMYPSHPTSNGTAPTPAEGYPYGPYTFYGTTPYFYPQYQGYPPPSPHPSMPPPSQHPSVPSPAPYHPGHFHPMPAPLQHSSIPPSQQPPPPHHPALEGPPSHQA